MRWLLVPRKDLKNRTPVGSAMDNKIYYEMKAYSEKTGIPISKILDKANGTAPE